MKSSSLALLESFHEMEGVVNDEKKTLKMYLNFYEFRPLVTTKIVEWNSKALTKETSRTQVPEWSNGADLRKVKISARETFRGFEPHLV